jgi:hypothetical protein
MQKDKWQALAILVAFNFTPACTTRNGLTIAGGTLLTGITMNATADSGDNDGAIAERHRGDWLILTGIGLLIGTLVVAGLRAQDAKPTKPAAVAGTFAAPSRPMSKELMALTKLALQAARSNLCADARGLTLRAAAIDAAHVEATLANDTAIRHCAEPQPQR